MGMKTATGTTPTAVTFNAIGGTHDIQLSVPRSAFMNESNDFANFPVKIEYLTFYLNSSNHTAGETYTVGLKEIALRYGHLSTSIDPAKYTNSYSIYPNPTNDSLVQLSGPATTEATLTLLGIDGKTHYRGTATGPTTQLSVEALPSGTYLLKIETEEKTETHRFIKH